MAGTFNVCNYTRKTNVAIPHERVDVDYLVAGTSLPLFLPPVRKGDELYVDSVWIQDANLMEAVRRGADELWLVWCIGNTGEYRTGAFNQYVHMIELSANGALFAEFERIREINERIARGDAPYGQRQPIRLHVIKPETRCPSIRISISAASTRTRCSRWGMPTRSATSRGDRREECRSSRRPHG